MAMQVSFPISILLAKLKEVISDQELLKHQQEAINNKAERLHREHSALSQAIKILGEDPIHLLRDTE